MDRVFSIRVFDKLNSVERIILVLGMELTKNKKYFNNTLLRSLFSCNNMSYKTVR